MSERGRLQVDVEGNASGFRQTLAGVKAHAGQFAKEVGANFSGVGKGFTAGIAGALSFEGIRSLSGKIMASFEGFVKRAGDIKDLSDQMGMGADETQRWDKSVRELGLSFGGLQSILATIEQTRADAFKDKGAAAKYAALGIDRADVLDTNRVGTSAFAQKVFAAGNRDDAGRAAYTDLLGKRAVKFLGAGDEYAKAKPDFSTEALQAADEIDKAEREIGNFWGKLWGGLVTKVVKTSKAAGEASAGMGGDVPTSMPAAPVPRKPPKDARIEDPLETAELEADIKKKAEGRAKNWEAEERLRDAQRKNMGAGARRASLQAELDLIRGKISRLAPFEGELPESDRARLTGYRTEEQGLLGQLKEKPLTIGVDGLAKSGLFSSSALNFSMSDDTQKAQLEALKVIARLISQRRDPHAL